MKNLYLTIGAVMLTVSIAAVVQGDVNPILQQARAEEDAAKAVDLYWKYFTQAPHDSTYLAAAGDFADLLSENHRHADLVRLGDLAAKLSPPVPDVLNTIAYALAQADTVLDKALMLSQQAVNVQQDLIHQPPPPDRSVAAWKERQASMLGYYLDTQGLVYLKQKKAKKALKVLLQADSLSEDADLYLHLAQAYWQIHNPKQALDWGIKALYEMGWQETPPIKEVIQGSYNMLHGSDEGLEAYKKSHLEDLRKTEYAKLVAKKLDLSATPFQLKDLNGKSISLADYKGRVVLVDFWATWCGPCKRELPLLQVAYPKWKEQGIELLALSTDKDTSKVAPFISQNNYTFPVLYGRATGKDYDVSGIPTLVVVDKSGRIQYRHLGYRPDVVDILNLQLAELNKK